MKTWITLEKALKISGHETPRALDRWVRRHNERHPNALVYRRPNRIALEDLQIAITMEAERHTPGLRTAKALSELAAKS